MDARKGRGDEWRQDYVTEGRAMKIGEKVLLIVGIAVLAFFAVSLVSLRFTVLRSVLNLEEREVQGQLMRARLALQERIDTLGIVNADWGAWDETYEFIHDLDRDYVETNLVSGMFTQLGINFFVCVDLSGRVVYIKCFDYLEEREVDPPRDLRDFVEKTRLFRAGSDGGGKVKGVVSLPRGPVLVSSHPITDSNETEPARGTLIMGRYLGAAEVSRVAHTTRLDVDLLEVDDPELPPLVRERFGAETGERLSAVVPVDRESVRGYLRIDDIHGEPARILMVRMFRDFYRQGRLSLYHYLSSLLVMGILCMGITYFMLKRVVLSRVAALHGAVGRLKESGDLSARIVLAGDDEMADLARAMSSMLEKLEQAHSSLGRREEEFRTLFEESPLGIELYSAEGKLLKVNEACLKLFGVSDPSVIEGFDLFRDPNLPADTKPSLEAGRIVRCEMDFDFEKVRRQGLFPTTRQGTASLEVVISPLGTARKESSGGYLVQVRDVTERKRTEAALIESERKVRSVSSQVLRAQEKERRRVSRELHDELGQGLSLLKLRVRSIQQGLGPGPAGIHDAFRETLEDIDTMIENVRRLSRDLSPSILEDIGLWPAVRWLADSFRAHDSIVCSTDIPDMESRFSPEKQILVFRIFQEALTNVAKHSRAEHVRLAVSKDDGNLVCEIHDDGSGFDMTEVRSREAMHRGMGLPTMEERTRMLGGALRVWSEPDHGTAITVTFPVSEEVPDGEDL